MFPFCWLPGVFWFLPFLGILVFLMLACFLVRRIFRGGMSCCGRKAGRRNAASDDPAGGL